MIKRDFDNRPALDLESSSAHSIKGKEEISRMDTNESPHLAPRLRAVRRRFSSGESQLSSNSTVTSANSSTSRPSQLGIELPPQDLPDRDECAIGEIDYTLMPASNTATIGPTTQGGDSEKSAIENQEKLTFGQRVWLAFKPLLNPPSLSLIASIIIANIQSLKALFVHTTAFSIPDAPDHKPPLDFIMEITRFATPCVPVLGMILVGAAFSRLSIKALPKGFWKTVVVMAVFKLVVGTLLVLFISLPNLLTKMKIFSEEVLIGNQGRSLGCCGPLNCLSIPPYCQKMTRSSGLL